MRGKPRISAALLARWGASSCAWSRRDGGGPLCVAVAVKRKTPWGRLWAAERIPCTLVLDGAEFATDVEEESSRLVAHAPSDEMVRPLQPGSPVAMIHGAPGTLGVFVRVKGTSQVLILSCSHVLARAGQLGNFGQLQEADKVIQQPLAPAATSNRVGLLTVDYTRLLPPADGKNDSDAALAQLDPGFPATAVQRFNQRVIVTHAEELPPKGTPTVLLGMMSRGATGRVLDPKFPSKRVDEVPFVESAIYTGMVSYESECDRGDSGGAVVDSENRLLGIHVAGNKDAQRGLFFPIGEYFRQRKLEVVTQI